MPRAPNPATCTGSMVRRHTCSARAPVPPPWSSSVAWAYHHHRLGTPGSLGPDVRSCAWDYPGIGHSTGEPMMTADQAASSLAGTLRAAEVPLPVILVGHSIAGLTTRLYVGQHPADVAGVVLFDPTVASFARMFDDTEFRPEWDGTTSADQAEQVTTWPDIPFEILLHDPAVYAAAEVWSAEVEEQWGTDEPHSQSSPRRAPSTSWRAPATTSTKTPSRSRSPPSAGSSTR